MKLLKFDFVLSVFLHILILLLFYFYNNGNNATVPVTLAAKPKTTQPIIKAALVDKQQLDKEVQILLQQEKLRKQRIIDEKQMLISERSKLAKDKLSLKNAKEKLQQQEQQAKKLALEAKKAVAKAQQLAQQQEIQQQNMVSQELQRAKESFRQQVQQHWIRPYGLDQSLKCCFDIHLDKNGTITAVTIFESSGNSAFDALAQKAIHNASPLHSLPTNNLVLEKLQHFRFVFEA